MMFAFVAVLSFSMVACNDDDDNSSAVLLESFGPSPVALGGQVIFIGQNLDKVSSIEFPMGYTVTDFEEKSAGRLVVIATRDTAQAYEGFVVLHSSKGDITSKTKIGYKQSAVITAIDGEVKPGAELTITGAYLSSVQQVILAGAEPISAENFKMHQNGTIKVVVPAEAKAGKVQVFNGTDYIYSEQELKITLPSGSAISKAENVYPGVDQITVTGKDLDLLASLTFANGVELKDFKVDGDKVSFTFPAEAADGDITAVAISGETNVIANVKSIVAPKVNWFNYDPEKQEALTDGTVYHLGTKVTLTGENLDLIKSVSFGDGVTSEVTVSDDKKSLYVNIPGTGTATNADQASGNMIVDEAHSWGRLYSGWQNGFVVKVDDKAGKLSSVIGYAYAEWGPANANGNMALADDKKSFKAFVNTDEPVDFVTEMNFNGKNCLDEYKANGFISAPLANVTACPVTIKYTNGTSKDIDCAAWSDWSTGAEVKMKATDLVDFPVIDMFPAEEVAGHLVEVTGINFTADTKFEFIAGDKVTPVVAKGFNNANSYFITLPQSLSGTYKLKVSNGDKSSVMENVSVAGSMATLFEGSWTLGWSKDCGGYDLSGVSKLQVYVEGSFGDWIGFMFQTEAGENIWPQKDFGDDFTVLEITGDDLKALQDKGTDWFVCGGTSGSATVTKIIAIY